MNFFTCLYMLYMYRIVFLIILPCFVFSSSSSSYILLLFFLPNWQLGVAVLGRRFAEKMVDVPIKKRRFSVRSPSPPPRTPSPDHEGSLSPQPQTPSPHPMESEQLGRMRPSAAGKLCSKDFFSSCDKWVFDKSVGLKFEDKVDKV